MKQFYRSLLLLALFLVGGAQLTSNAQVTYTCTAGKKFGDNEGCQKIFDGNVNTKWAENSGEDCFVLFNTSTPVYVWGYEFTTANDNYEYDRRQKRWALYGATTDLAQDADGWVELASVSEKDWIVRKNFYTQRFYCKDGAEDNAYKYFKLDILSGGFMQFSEFKLCCDTNPIVTMDWVNGTDGSANAFDRNIDNKWGNGNVKGGWFVLKTSDDQAHTLKDYMFSTHDDGSWQNRAPKNWTIEVGNTESGPWYAIDHVTNDPIANENYTTYDFEPANAEREFKYMKVTINEVKGTGNYYQIAEFFAIVGNKNAQNVGYKYVEGDNGNLAKVFDKDSHSKAEGGDMPDGVKFIVETNDDQPHTVKKYYMSTHDDGSWNDRAPKSWVLEGSNDKSNWIPIDDVTDGEIPNVNYTTKAFVPSNQDAAVRYLRMTIRSFKGGYHQLAEFDAASGCATHNWIVDDNVDPTCEDTGHTLQHCSVCGAIKDIATIPAKGHSYTSHVCTVCGKPEPNFMTENDGWYEPTSAEHFTWLAAVVKNGGSNAKIRLTQDVDLAGFAGFEKGENAVEYAGEFDGQGYWLKNYSTNVTLKNTGIFGKTNGASIHDLGITGADVTTNQQNAAILVGNANNTTINKVAILNSRLQGVDHVGSIAGNTEGSTTISNCLSGCEVVSTSWQAGGLIGTSNGITLEKNLFLGSVSNAGGGGNAAGLISLLEGGTHTISNNISAASLIYAQNRDVMPIAVPDGKTATYTNNRVAASSLFRKGGNEPATQNYDEVNGNLGLTTADRDMQCKSFLSTTMGWDMTNDWKMVAAGQWPVLAWMDATTPTQEVTITAAGYATIVAAGELDFTGSDVEAFAAQDMGTHIHLEPVTEVPAGEPVVIKGAEGSHNISYNVDYASALTNDLKVSDGVEADGSQYILAKPDGKKVGFYRATTGTTITAGKAYLVSINSINALFFDEDEETAVEAVKAEQNSENVVYNLAGQRITKMQRGVNIVNGKKVLK